MKIAALALSLLSTAGAFAPSLRSRQHLTQLEAERKPFISGNWKLNPQTREEATSLASEIAASITKDTPDADIALFVPYVFIEAAQKAAEGKLMIGAEVSNDSTSLAFWRLMFFFPQIFVFCPLSHAISHNNHHQHY
jgi:hypothetical protein